MFFSFSGLAYSCGFLGTGFLTYRFSQYKRKEKTIVSKLIFYISALFSLFFLSTAVIVLFFGENPLALKWAVVNAMFIEGIAVSLIAYLVIYTNIPRISPWLGFSIFFILGLIQTGLTIFDPIRPFFEESGSVNWLSPAGFKSILLTVLYLLTFLPLIITILRQAKTSSEFYVKMKSVGLCIVLFFGITIVLFDCFLINSLKTPAVFRDVVIIFLSLFLFIFTLFIPKPFLPEEKYTPSPSLPEIKW